MARRVPRGFVGVILGWFLLFRSVLRRLRSLLGLVVGHVFAPAEAAPVTGRAHEHFRLGRAYAQGAGVAQDYAEAGRWYRLAAEGGVEEAAAELGFLYLDGKGVNQDCAEAARWLIRAANAGIAAAQGALGLMYGEGRGVERCYVRALLWLALALEHLSPQQKSEREIAARARDWLIARMTPDQRADAERRKRSFSPA